MPYLFLLFLIVPLIEIYFLIQIGGAIGAGLTIFLVVLTAMIGAFLVRQQGLSTLMRAQNHINKGQTPALEMLEGLLLFVAGALLLTPGFFTDALGFLILTPPIRRLFIKKLMSRAMTRTQFHYQQHKSTSSHSGRIIDVDIEADNDDTDKSGK